MMQNPVAGNQSIAPPTNPVNASHQGLCTIERIDAIEMLIPTTR